jgi:hypothetical protein
MCGGLSECFDIRRISIDGMCIVCVSYMVSLPSRAEMA